MRLGKWKLRWKIHLLTAMLVLDGLLAGGTAGWICAVQETGTVQASSDRPTAGKPVVALTFDDGPHAKYTPQLLDGLKARGVHATFFLMGENIAGKEDLVRRMAQEGHLIGNHSYRHIRLTTAGEEAVCQSIEKTQQIIAGITGRAPAYLRPPYGDWNEQLECRLEITPVFWTVDSLDWKLRNTKAIVRRVKSSVQNGDIILFHDIFPTSVEAALELVDLLTEEGYAFVTVDELLID
jgi:peptidoglycan/xylan/chitin deacetylase (PgdA/CDA1 family)